MYSVIAAQRKSLRFPTILDDLEICRIPQIPHDGIAVTYKFPVCAKRTQAVKMSSWHMLSDWAVLQFLCTSELVFVFVVLSDLSAVLVDWQRHQGGLFFLTTAKF